MGSDTHDSFAPVTRFADFKEDVDAVNRNLSRKREAESLCFPCDHVQLVAKFTHLTSSIWFSF